MLTRTRRRVALVASCLGLVLLPSAHARAAGFAIFEQGARGMGFAGAFTAQASDPSAIFHNAAGIAFLKGDQLYLGGTFVAPSTDFAGADPFPGAGRAETMDAGVIPLPTAYYTHQFSERVVLGVGVDVPFGLKARWAEPDDFSGRFISRLAELKGFSINPTLAYKIEDRLAIGAGFDIRLASVTLERRVPLINPFTQKVIDVATARLESDTNAGYGFNLGLLAKPSESLSIGVSYRHRANVDFTGSGTFARISTGNAQLDARVAAILPAGAVPLQTAVEFPAIFSGGAAYTWGDWTVEGDVNWYQWSTFDRLILTFAKRPDLNQVITENYKDSLQYRLGIERRLSEAWAIRGGYFYDASPAPPESVSPILPDASRHGICLGGSWRRGSLRLDAATWYVLFKDRSTEGLNPDGYDGTYSSHAATLGVFLGYGF